MTKNHASHYLEGNNKEIKAAAAATATNNKKREKEEITKLKEA